MQACDPGIQPVETTLDPDYHGNTGHRHLCRPGRAGRGIFILFADVRRRTEFFRIAVSAEMEPNAARTLRLRAFFRMFPSGHAPASYYDYVAGRRAEPWTDATLAEWRASGEEALQLELGRSEDDDRLYARISRVINSDRPWVLIGGPPCQAYSLVGRARNKGIAGYRADTDSRHELYKHYLHIIQRHAPAAFVMENVKGILSSRVNGELMFPRILEDLSRPGGKQGPRYDIVPLLVPDDSRHNSQSPKDFVLRAEDMGVPQARHRVVLLGVAEGIARDRATFLKPIAQRFSVNDVIKGMPRRRSGVTDATVDLWSSTAANILEVASRAAGPGRPIVAKALAKLATKAERCRSDPGPGGRWTPRTAHSDNVPLHLRSWLLDPRLDGIPNHEVREHMTSDLVRYAYASMFAQTHGHSPRGSADFPMALHPLHKNWESGKFVDRFKVQIGDQPSSTVTSHLSRDGHYFIHPDPSQFRSLSVREAARLQTFPDNYFFEGSRGAQFRQVGNAVPPWLARQIAATVYSILAGA